MLCQYDDQDAFGYSSLHQNELLLERLTDICSAVILRHANLANVCATLVEASYYNATALVDRLHRYMSRNLETIMESRLLDELPPEMIKSFAAFVRGEQIKKHPYIRNGGNMRYLETFWEDWIAEQDISTPIIPRNVGTTSKHQVPNSPGEVEKKTTPNPSLIKSQVTFEAIDDSEEIFTMDGVHNESTSSAPITVPWKSLSSTRKVDMKSIMEAEKMASTTRSGASDGNKRVLDNIARPNRTSAPIPVVHSLINSDSSKPSTSTSTTPPSRSNPTIWKQVSPSSPAGPSVLPHGSPARSVPTGRSSLSGLGRAASDLGPLIVPTKTKAPDSLRRRASG